MKRMLAALIGLCLIAGAGLSAPIVYDGETPEEQGGQMVGFPAGFFGEKGPAYDFIDLSNFSYFGDYSENHVFSGIAIKPDGTKITLSNTGSGNDIVNYSLGTANDINSISKSSTWDNKPQLAYDFADNGSIFYMRDFTFHIQTNSYELNQNTYTSDDVATGLKPNDFTISDTGYFSYEVNNSTTITQKEYSTAYDISSQINTKNIDITESVSSVDYVNPRQILLFDENNKVILDYRMTKDNDLSTLKKESQLDVSDKISLSNVWIEHTNKQNIFLAEQDNTIFQYQSN